MVLLVCALTLGWRLITHHTTNNIYQTHDVTLMSLHPSKTATDVPGYIGVCGPYQYGSKPVYCGKRSTYNYVEKNKAEIGKWDGKTILGEGNSYTLHICWAPIVRSWHSYKTWYWRCLVLLQWGAGLDSNIDITSKVFLPKWPIISLLSFWSLSWEEEDVK